MATTIDTYFDDEVTLTSRIGIVVATTDKTSVEAEVIYSPGDEDELIYHTKLQAYNGRVEFHDVGQVIADKLREKDKIYERVRISIDGSEVTLLAMVCDYAVADNFEPTENYLTATRTSIVHMASRIHLAHYPDWHERYLVQTVGIGPDGDMTVAENEITSPAELDYSVSDLVAYAYDDRNRMRKVAYFAITHGRMQHIYYIAEDPSYITFSYKNIFNSKEYVDVVGTVKRKTSVERSLAVCGSKSVQYDRKVARTYELQTAALTADQAREIEQMIISPKVKLCSPSGEWDMLITDHTCEVSDDDTNLTTMKFTFRLADEQAAEPLDALPPAIRVFSQEFNNSFA